MHWRKPLTPALPLNHSVLPGVAPAVPTLTGEIGSAGGTHGSTRRFMWRVGVRIPPTQFCALNPRTEERPLTLPLSPAPSGGEGGRRLGEGEVHGEGIALLHGYG